MHCAGLPITAQVSQSVGSNIGYYISATCVILGGLCLSCVDVHKKRLRRKRRLRQCKSTASTATAATSTTFNSTTGTIHRHLYSTHSQSIDTPQNSKIMMVASSNEAKDFESIGLVGPSLDQASSHHSEAADPNDPVSQQQQQQPITVYLVKSHSEAETLDHHQANSQKLMSFEMMEPAVFKMMTQEEEEEEDDEIMLEEDEDLVFNEDYLMEGITSCAKVENCVILSEFEQNCLKENQNCGAEQQQKRMRDTKRWQQKKLTNPEAMMANRGKKWNQVLPGPSKEMATVLEETV